ncbi:hypothetical protein LTR36_002352 [Oleoguttula mirabilis]|uniref:F-box domain-containing protein n=1 Tax=Oleoguttula mirabilis TaxID=1507867 RepID=A0AAV9JLU7_9PEZI|nr:hypothetical protein LTR36_002352 [Oleoguttula mirabilis]
MGYFEQVCQICAIAFNVGRIRKEGMDMTSTLQVEQPPLDSAKPKGAPTSYARQIPGPMKLSHSSQKAWNIPGPKRNTSPGQIAQVPSGKQTDCAGEMEHCISTQCLAAKLPGWQPERDDEEFETEARFCFLTGISKKSVYEWDVSSLKPRRHGIDETAILNNSQADKGLGEKSAMPMHPKCFELFKLVSQQRLGKVDIDGLWRLREEQGEFGDRFENFPHSSDVDVVDEQWYNCEPGTEYLAANSVDVPFLDGLIQSCIPETTDVGEVVFDAPERSESGHDAFSPLSPEICQMLMGYLSRRDVANLRCVSGSFIQLPQTYFRQLIKTEMPWMWELAALRGVDWYSLWCKLSVADGGAGLDENERKWLKDVPRLQYGKLHEELVAEGKPMSNPGQSGFNEEWRQRHSAMKRAADAEIKAGYDAGMWPARSNHVLLGLRNRRRIWEDLEEIMRRIAALLPDDLA